MNINYKNPKIDLARFFGHIISDGCLAKCGRIIYSNQDYGLITNMANIMNSYLKQPSIYFNKKGNIYNCVIHSKKLTNKLKKIIPKLNIINWSLESQKEFVSACFDDEGTISKKSGIISINQKDKKYINNISKILEKIGIKYTLFSFYNKKYCSTYYALRIPVGFNNTFNKEIGFLHYNKKELLLQYLSRFNSRIRRRNEIINIDKQKYEGEGYARKIGNYFYKYKSIRNGNKIISKYLGRVNKEEIESIKY